VTGRWFSHRTPVSSTNTTDRLDIALLKVALNTTFINLIVSVLLYFYILGFQKFWKVQLSLYRNPFHSVFGMTGFSVCI
jgi:hypothetical protein